VSSGCIAVHVLSVIADIELPHNAINSRNLRDSVENADVGNVVDFVQETHFCSIINFVISVLLHRNCFLLQPF